MGTCETCLYFKAGNITIDVEPPITYGQCQKLGQMFPSHFGCNLYKDKDAARTKPAATERQEPHE